MDEPNNGVATGKTKISRKRHPWVYKDQYDRILADHNRWRRFAVLFGFVTIIELIFLLRVFS